jgi:hypothetical protein
MPVRFRCVYCNQLLGISRRKAGTIVRCTSCEGQLIVPDPSDAPTHGEEPSAESPSDEPHKAEGSSGSGGVFDADEFDAFLEPLAPAAGPAVATPPAPPARQHPAAPVEAIVGVVPPPAVAFTRRSLTIAVALAIVALCLSFGSGLWLGMALRRG